MIDAEVSSCIRARLRAGAVSEDWAALRRSCSDGERRATCQGSNSRGAALWQYREAWRAYRVNLRLGVPATRRDEERTMDQLGEVWDELVRDVRRISREEDPELSRLLSALRDVAILGPEASVLGPGAPQALSEAKRLQGSMSESNRPEERDAVGELVARNEQGDPDWIRASAFRLASVRASVLTARDPALEQEATRLWVIAESRRQLDILAGIKYRSPFLREDAMHAKNFLRRALEPDYNPRFTPYDPPPMWSSTEPAAVQPAGPRDSTPSGVRRSAVGSVASGGARSVTAGRSLPVVGGNAGQRRVG